MAGGRGARLTRRVLACSHRRTRFSGSRPGRHEENPEQGCPTAPSRSPPPDMTVLSDSFRPRRAVPDGRSTPRSGRGDPASKYPLPGNRAGPAPAAAIQAEQAKAKHRDRPHRLLCTTRELRRRWRPRDDQGPTPGGAARDFHEVWPAPAAPGSWYALRRRPASCLNSWLMVAGLERYTTRSPRMLPGRGTLRGRDPPARGSPQGWTFPRASFRHPGRRLIELGEEGSSARSGRSLAGKRDPAPDFFSAADYAESRWPATGQGGQARPAVFGIELTDHHRLYFSRTTGLRVFQKNRKPGGPAS